MKLQLFVLKRLTTSVQFLIVLLVNYLKRQKNNTRLLFLNTVHIPQWKNLRPKNSFSFLDKSGGWNSRRFIMRHCYIKYPQMPILSIWGQPYLASKYTPPLHYLLILRWCNNPCSSCHSEKHWFPPSQILRFRKTVVSSLCRYQPASSDVCTLGVHS